ncbi:MAG TPA: hypothetical protein VHH34_11710 [Pseudonocardiaceae bacterium]|nr:hypothetical protein [Pseudonocardiaceae bacterium]
MVAAGRLRSARWREADRFGLTVTDNSQHVWIDNPAGCHIWPL